MGDVILRKGRLRSVERGHPWVFRDAVARVQGLPRDGDWVRVRDGTGRILGTGWYSARSKIVVRLLARGEEEVEDALLVRRIETAWQLRTDVLRLPEFTNAFRLVHSEGDALPGVVADFFDGWIVVQLSTAGAEQRRELILDALESVTGARGIYERPEAAAQKREGLSQEAGWRRRSAPPETAVQVHEYGVHFGVEPGSGQKTGFFADQRSNRRRVGALVAGRDVLDLHTYTGGFALHAATAGARSVVGVDSSAPALDTARRNAALNDVRDRVSWVRGDAAEELNRLRREGRSFDVVISDPPKLARRKQDLQKAERAYKDLHLRSLRVLRPGGLYAASSCSGLVDDAAFARTLSNAAADTGRDLQILHRGGQGPDHPVLTTCPESRYLSFLLARVG